MNAFHTIRRDDPRGAVADDAAQWRIEASCFNCSAAQTLAPSLIVESGGRSAFAHQPQTQAELDDAWRATLICPVAAVRAPQSLKPPAVPLFPQQLDTGVYRLGYNARSSWGAHSYALTRSDGIVMSDAPRWTTKLTRWIENVGGLHSILLTHKDDVADAERYAHRFGSRVFIHDADAESAAFATDRIEGLLPSLILPGITAIPVPGHTRGSVLYLTDRGHLFTGDSLAWDHLNRAITAFKQACWYDWPTQLRSLARLSEYAFEWILPGHGGNVHREPSELRDALARFLAEATKDTSSFQPQEHL